MTIRHVEYDRHCVSCKQHIPLSTDSHNHHIYHSLHIGNNKKLTLYKIPNVSAKSSPSFLASVIDFIGALKG